MHAHGYMLEVQYDGHTLTAEGTNKASQTALRGQDYAAGPLVLPREDIARVELKPASALTNGRLTVHTADGGKYVLHFRRKQADDFTALAAALS
jgi:hypothetical protein